MGQPFASAQHAIGNCDRCGFQYKLTELRSEVIDLHVTGFLVCSECWDPDQPQLQVGRWPVSDPQAIRNPRPDTGVDASRFGDSIRYEFDTQSSADLWNVIPGGFNATVTWESSSETILLTADAADPMLVRKSTVANPISFDPVVYRYLRCRMKVNDFGADRYSWEGRFYWIRESDTDNDFSASRVHRTVEGRPDFEDMGDPWHLITWDMKGVTNWSTGSNIDGIRLDFLSLDNTVVEVDYIRFETGPQDQ